MVHLVMNDMMKSEMDDISRHEKQAGNPPPKVSCGFGISPLFSLKFFPLPI